MRIAVTGANGFIGSRIATHLYDRGHEVTAIVRPGRAAPDRVSVLEHDLSHGPFDGTSFDLVVHCAGEIRPSTPQAAIADCLNVRLARQVAQSGCEKLLVLSSISAAIAERTPDAARRYGKEKLAAEHEVRVQGSGSVVFLRAPAIYGKAAKGPLAALAKLIAKGVPLPLAAARTPRPYLSVNNLLSLIATIAESPQHLWDAANGTAPEPDDGELIDTATLCRMIASKTGHSARLFPCPAGLLRLAGRMTGKQDLISGALDAVPLDPNRGGLSLWQWTPVKRMPDSLRF